MKLIKPSTEILTSIDGEEILKEIEIIARTCYKSEDKITDDGLSARKLITQLIKNKHEAMLEFGPSITVKFICDRGVSHELVRHRIASFAQESTRYCNYSKDDHMLFIVPFWLDLTDWNNQITVPSDDPRQIWLREMSRSEISYNKLIKQGWSAQKARSVLPNSLKTEINVCANIREYRHIFNLRCHPSAHPQMRELMIPLLDEFKSKIPILFDDINY